MPLIKGIGAAILTAFAVGAVSKFLKKFKDFITKAAAGSAVFEALKKLREFLFHRWSTGPVFEVFFFGASIV